MRESGGALHVEPDRVIQVVVLGPGQEAVLGNVAAGVFDHRIAPDLALEFLNDPRHHLAVALEGAVVVGFASAVSYVHPDKAVELWINEVGVAPEHRERGVGRRLVEALLAVGRALGCSEAWVLTDRDNTAARALYASAGGVEAQSDIVMFGFRLEGG